MVDPETLDRALVIAGAVVPLLSAVASLLNHVIRKRLEAKQPMSPLLSGAGTVINLVSINLDKAVQLARLARGKPAVGAPPAPSAVPPSQLVLPLEPKTPTVPPPSAKP